MSGSHAGYAVIVQDSKLAYANNMTSQILRLTRGQLYDLNGHITYISQSDLVSLDKSFLYFVSPSSVPSDGLTNVFSVDGQGNLVVTVNGTALMAIICSSDNYIRFGYSSGTCEAVVLGSQTPASSAPTLSPSSVPASSQPVIVSSTPTPLSRQAHHQRHLSLLRAFLPKRHHQFPRRAVSRHRPFLVSKAPQILTKSVKAPSACHLPTL
jgi:hypothetical protein